MRDRWSRRWRRRNRRPPSSRIYLAISVSSIVLALCWMVYAWYAAASDFRNPLLGYGFGIGWAVVGMAWFRKAVLLRRAEDKNAGQVGRQRSGKNRFEVWP